MPVIDMVLTLQKLSTKMTSVVINIIPVIFKKINITGHFQVVTNITGHFQDKLTDRKKIERHAN